MIGIPEKLEPLAAAGRDVDPEASRHDHGGKGSSHRRGKQPLTPSAINLGQQAEPLIAVAEVAPHTLDEIG